MSDDVTPDELPSDAAAPAAAETGPETAAQAAPAAPRRRHPFYLRGRRPRMPRSKGGLFALLLVLAGMGGAAVFTGVSLIQWTETADFCGRCHTMAPELAAYEAGPHRDVSCAECHVEPGITGWVKAKVNGTRQLVDLILGTFPEPIPAPDHDDLPSSADTCAKCHDASYTVEKYMPGSGSTAGGLTVRTHTFNKNQTRTTSGMTAKGEPEYYKK